MQPRFLLLTGKGLLEKKGFSVELLSYQCKPRRQFDSSWNRFGKPANLCNAHVRTQSASILFHLIHGGCCIFSTVHSNNFGANDGTVSCFCVEYACACDISGGLFVSFHASHTHLLASSPGYQRICKFHKPLCGSWMRPFVSLTAARDSRTPALSIRPFFRTYQYTTQDGNRSFR